MDAFVNKEDENDETIDSIHDKTVENNDGAGDTIVKKEVNTMDNLVGNEVDIIAKTFKQETDIFDEIVKNEVDILNEKADIEDSKFWLKVKKEDVNNDKYSVKDCDNKEKIISPISEDAESDKKNPKSKYAVSKPRRTTRGNKAVFPEENKAKKNQRKSDFLEEIPTTTKYIAEARGPVDYTDILIEKEKIYTVEPSTSRRSTRGICASYNEKQVEKDAKLKVEKEPSPCRRSLRTSRSSALAGQEEKQMTSIATNIDRVENEKEEVVEVYASQTIKKYITINLCRLQETVEPTWSEQSSSRSIDSPKKKKAKTFQAVRSSRRAAIAASLAMATQMKDQQTSQAVSLESGDSDS